MRVLRDSICQKYSRVSDNSNIGEHSLRISTRELVRQKAYQGIVIHIQYASPVGRAPEGGNVGFVVGESRCLGGQGFQRISYERLRPPPPAGSRHRCFTSCASSR